jgi:Zn-dependent M28 family amino/carboxypeptidase
VGAHYDSVQGAPGGNDNGSGVAAALELARALRDAKPARTLRFVFFVNEEPPFFEGMDMGCRRYALRSKERKERIVAMFSLETMGWYSDSPDSQRYPFPLSLFYPSTGDFIAFVANLGSRARSCTSRSARSGITRSSRPRASPPRRSFRASAGRTTPRSGSRATPG